MRLFCSNIDCDNLIFTAIYVQIHLPEFLLYIRLQLIVDECNCYACHGEAARTQSTPYWLFDQNWMEYCQNKTHTPTRLWRSPATQFTHTSPAHARTQHQCHQWPDQRRRRVCVCVWDVCICCKFICFYCVLETNCKPATTVYAVCRLLEATFGRSEDKRIMRTIVGRSTRSVETITLCASNFIKYK